MLTCFNVQKTHYFSNTVHYCRSSMARLSQTLRFLQSPSFRQVQSALIGQLAQCIVIGRTPQARVGNVTALSIIASFGFFKMNVKTVNNVLSFTIRSSQRGEQSRVTDTVMMLVCVCKQAAIKIADVLWCDPVSLALTRTHTHTHTTHETPHNQLVTLQRERKTWNRILWPL